MSPVILRSETTKNLVAGGGRPVKGRRLGAVLGCVGLLDPKTLVPQTPAPQTPAPLARPIKSKARHPDVSERFKLA